MSDQLYRRLKQPEPLRLQVHQTLEELIVNGHLEPGTRLVETELADRLGVSRGPIREALQMLAREGWVELRPRHGAHVAQPTLDEIVDYFDVRALLEVEAARLAARSVKKGLTEDQNALLRDLDETVVRGIEDARRSHSSDPEVDMSDVEEARRFHRERSQRFHHVLAALSANTALADLLDRLSKRTRWYFSPRILERAVQAWEEHDALHAAVARGDEDEAAFLMLNHMQATRSTFLKAHDHD